MLFCSIFIGVSTAYGQVNERAMHCLNMLIEGINIRNIPSCVETLQLTQGPRPSMTNLTTERSNNSIATSMPLSPEDDSNNETMIIEQPSQYQWLTYNDPICRYPLNILRHGK
jgi:hypothetical protein